MSSVAVPQLRGRSLGFGFDLPWGGAVGFVPTADGRTELSQPLRGFLGGSAHAFSHGFFSWQPRDRGRLRLADYVAAWDVLADALPPGLPLALHHTALNLGGLVEPAGAAYEELIGFTNALCERYSIRWINEDVGLWYLAGRPLPYPLPPILSGAGLAACVRNVQRCQRLLSAPLVLEFPGFASGVSLVLGELDAYDFFRILAESTGAPVTLDVGHLLSWRYMRGMRGPALLEGLERLPLANTFEIHLSGCQIDGERFIDAHHGDLLDEQLLLLEQLLPRCPHLRAVTFEDPRLLASGALDQRSERSLLRLRAVLERWMPAAPVRHAAAACGGSADGPPLTSFAAGDEPSAIADVEESLVALLLSRARRDQWRASRNCEQETGANPALLSALNPQELELVAAQMLALVRARRHRGAGTLVQQFPGVVAAFRVAHPDDAELHGLFCAFLESEAASHWREQPGGRLGCSLEEAFADFAAAQPWMDPAACQAELLSALLKTLAVCPEPAFIVPGSVRRAPGGWVAVSAAVPPVLYAAIDGQFMTGPITPAIAHLLSAAPGAHGEIDSPVAPPTAQRTRDGAAATPGKSEAGRAALRAVLVARRLLA